ncbi:MAG: phosphodiester glycosidase family protein [Desulfotomaculaceae bacterium]|nr:phosphodiester glycosidase family protein [Desulfotomaculaceae bacterium]
MKIKNNIILITLLAINFFAGFYLYTILREDSDEISYQGKNINITIQDIRGDNYRGKVMYIRSEVPDRIKIALSARGLGTTETTSSMAKRTGAIAAVNGGGFYNNPVSGKPLNFPVYVTIHEGKLIYYDRPIYPMTAVGINQSGNLVFSKKGPQDLLKHGVQEAVSFTPALIINGRPVPYSREEEIAPRTAVGQTKTGDYIFVVIDERNPKWSEGVNIRQLTDIMMSLGAYNAFNLDGGGSSTMVFRGRVINKPSDITGERAVATCWVVYD